MPKSYLQGTKPNYPLRSGSYEASEIIESFGGPSWFQDLRLSSSAEESHRRMQKANADHRRSYEGDRLLSRRWDAVRDDAGSLTAPESLFSFLTAMPENFLIMRHPELPPGHKQDLFILHAYMKDRRWSIDEVFEEGFGTRVISKHFQYFKETLRCPGMFAVPNWWYTETQNIVYLSIAQRLTEHFDEPFPGGSYENVLMKAGDWARRQEATNPTQFKEYLGHMNQYVHDLVAAQEYPEMVPFNTTFINFEDETSFAGHLIYNRYLDQTGQVRYHACPTNAVGPHGDVVPLDAIFQAGLYFHETKRKTAHEKEGAIADRVIYGLYHGYVLSREHCPEGSSFIRIPMICPIHVGGRWFPHQPEIEGQYVVQSPVIPVINMMIEGLNEHKMVSMNFTKAQRKRSVKVGKESGAGKVTPRRYMRVQMSAGTIQIPQAEECPLMRLPKWKLTKRIKCRKHERCYVKHGRLPLEVEHKELLLSRGYTIYKDNLDIGPRDEKRLKLRRIPFPDGFRWVAIRTIIIDEHKRGPEGTDVVPLVLVPDSKVMKQSTEFELNSIRR